MAGKLQRIEQKYLLKIEAEVGNVEQRFAKISQALEKIDKAALPDDIAKGYKNLTKDLEKMREIMNKGFGKKEDAKKFEAYLKTLENKYKNYAERIEQLKIDPTKAFNKEIKAYKDLVNEKIKAEQELSKKQKKIQEHQMQSQRGYGGISKELQGSAKKGSAELEATRLNLIALQESTKEYKDGNIIVQNISTEKKKQLTIDQAILAIEEKKEKSLKRQEDLRNKANVQQSEIKKKYGEKRKQVESEYGEDGKRFQSLKYANDPGYYKTQLDSIANNKKLSSEEKQKQKNALYRQKSSGQKAINAAGGYDNAVAILEQEKEAALIKLEDKKQKELSLSNELYNKEKAIALELDNQLKALNELVKIKQKINNINQIAQDYETNATEIDIANQDIKNAKSNIENYETQIIPETKQAFDEIINNSREASGSIEKVKQETEEMGNEFKEAAEQSKSLAQIKSYFNYWFSVGTILNKISQAVTSAVNDFKELDKQFNEISIVTGKTMNELWEGFSNLNRIAQEYGVTTSNVVSVQKLYYQQGRSAADVTQLTGETLKFARISGLDYAEATNYMTASLNAYKIEASEASKITDTFAALSMSAAVDANEVAVAMSKVASLAAGAGSSFEDTSAYLSKIIETTR